MAQGREGRTMSLWPHQVTFTEQVPAAIDAGEQALCVTSPTGGGKSTMMTWLIRWALERAWKSVLYTDRVMLRQQLSDVLNEQDIKHGVRARGERPEKWRAVQVSS